MSHVTSMDGTRIGYSHRGDGPPLILVDGAFCSRAFGPSPKIAPLLAERFTVYAYDRRGRGESGDTAPYAPGREVEDLAALVQETGGTATLLGLSSGAALALEAAAAGVPVSRVIAYEPPYVDEAGDRNGAAHEPHLRELLARNDRGGAVKYFMKDMVGAPAFLVPMMRMMPWVWSKLTAAAHTLPYDAAVMSQFKVPRGRFATIHVPVLVMNGGKTDARLRDAAKTVASVIAGAEYRELAGQTHNVSAKALAPSVVDYVLS